MEINKAITNLEFSKWIVAPSCNEALNQAQSFWDSQEVLSSSSDAICFQHILDAGRKSDFDDIEWLVQSKIECLKDREENVVKYARRKNWGREDILNRIITSSTGSLKER